MKNTRVAGHGLLAEGAPFLRNEEGDWSRVGYLFISTSGRGRGVCQCGKASPILDSSTQRRKWHREHKAEVSA